MKIKPFLLSLLAGFASLQAPAQSNVTSINIVGYVNIPFRPGDNLFGNPLQGQTNNLLSSIIPTAPVGTTVSLWNSTAHQFTTTSTFQGGGWSLDFDLAPGQGALLHTGTLFTNTFLGTVLAPDGSIFTDSGPVNPPPPFAGPDGTYLLSSKFPNTLSATNGFPVFNYILGRAPLAGEQFTTLDPATQLYHTTTFVSGAWDNGDPVLSLGSSAFFNIGPVAVPEPSVLALAMAGIALRMVRRR